ncbi:MAG: molybdate ABC transporter substrate-binding protein [Firmicutes bacterium]|nr:molybdate ABC transporter substrate-binding protein [Bacillota bacterium]
MRKFLSVLLVVLLLTFVVSAVYAAEDLSRFKGQQLRLFVAAGMKNPMDETIAAFEKASGVRVLPNYGPSGGLYAQIDLNQPCDLYFTADWLYIDKLAESGKLVRARKFLSDNIVLVVSSGGKSKVQKVEDLIKPDVSLVLADQLAPVGVYAENGLRSLGLWDKLGDNVKARPSTVNQVAIMVQQNQVDAGLIFSSVANSYGLEPVDVIDMKHTGEIIFATAIIKGGNTELAEAFENFAFQHAANFAKYGWVPYE